jgi:hypothetical protein
MKKYCIITWINLIVLTIFLGYAGFCCAEDFTFNVPVALYNINVPMARQGDVYCQATNRLVPANQQKFMIGSGFTVYSITGGNYVGTVTVKFNANNGVKAADATDWGCWLHINSVYLENTPACQYGTADCVDLSLGPSGHDRTKPFTSTVSGIIK